MGFGVRGFGERVLHEVDADAPPLVLFAPGGSMADVRIGQPNANFHKDATRRLGDRSP